MNKLFLAFFIFFWVFSLRFASLIIAQGLHPIVFEKASFSDPIKFDLDPNLKEHTDTIPLKKVIAPKDISKESMEDTDFIIKKPRYTIQLNSQKLDKNGKPLVNSRSNSRKAWLFSAVVPGLGQYYNHSYLKIPIIYGLFVSAFLYISFNNTQYQLALNAYKARLLNNTSTNIRPIEYNSTNIPDITQLNTQVVQFYKKSLDYGVIAAAGVWALNTIDAFVVSELKGFDVSNDLTIRIRPTLLPGPGSVFLANGESQGLGSLGFIPGIKMSIHLR